MTKTATTDPTDPSSLSCKTRYPLLLVHGVGVRDHANFGIWGRIPQTLEAHGATVYFGEHDAWGTCRSNAVQLLERLPQILATSGATKINIIAHSKGGLDSRYLISLFPEDELPIASLTTIATPHHGSRSLDVLFSAARPLLTSLAPLINATYRKLGDQRPDFVGACRDLTASHMKKFNALQPSLEPVYSQQFSGNLHGVLDDPLSLATYSFIYLFEGANDGLVAMQSASYDNHRGEITTQTGRGVTHPLLVDVTKKPFSLRTLPGSSRQENMLHTNKAQRVPLQVADILEFYVALVSELKDLGF